MGNLTHPADAEYIGILEAVVAVLAVKLGMHPEVTMANAIKDIARQANMETIDTDRLIESRWTGRNVRQIVHVANAIPTITDVSGNRSLENNSLNRDDDHSQLSYRERAREFKKRRELSSDATTLEDKSS